VPLASPSCPLSWFRNLISRYRQDRHGIQFFIDRDY
jgi:hypothetical protein